MMILDVIERDDHQNPFFQGLLNLSSAEEN